MTHRKQSKPKSSPATAAPANKATHRTAAPANHPKQTAANVAAQPPAQRAQFMLQMQQQLGNQSVQRFLAGSQQQIQREDDDQDGGSNALYDTVYDQYWRLVRGMTEAEELGVYGTRQRRDWLSYLQRNVQLGSPDEMGIPALAQLQTKLRALRQQVNAEYEQADEYWIGLTDEYYAERDRLEGQATLEAQCALKLLDEAYEATDTRVEYVGEFMVREDVDLFDHMLEHGSHVDKGEELAWRLQDKIAALEAELGGDEVRIPIISDISDDLSMVWSVVGWDDWGDFLVDMGLTFATAGVAKIARSAKKGSRAYKVYKNRKRLQRLRRLKKMEKAGRHVGAVVQQILALIAGVGKETVVEQKEWVFAKWPTLLRRIGTDLGADLAGGNLTNIPSVAVQRINKEVLSEIVEQTLNIDKSKIEQWAKLTGIALLRRDTKLARQLFFKFFGLAVKRRLASNAVYYGLTSASKGTVSLDPGAVFNPALLREIALASAAELAQDVTLMIPFADMPGVRDMIETARKYLKDGLSAALK